MRSWFATSLVETREELRDSFFIVRLSSSAKMSDDLSSLVAAFQSRAQQQQPQQTQRGRLPRPQGTKHLMKLVSAPTASEGLRVCFSGKLLRSPKLGVALGM